MIKDYCEYGKLTFHIAHNIPVTFIRAPKKKKNWKFVQGLSYTKCRTAKIKGPIKIAQ